MSSCNPWARPQLQVWRTPTAALPCPVSRRGLSAPTVGRPSWWRCSAEGGPAGLVKITRGPDHTDNTAGYRSGTATGFGAEEELHQSQRIQSAQELAYHAWVAEDIHHTGSSTSRRREGAVDGWRKLIGAGHPLA